MVNVNIPVYLLEENDKMGRQDSVYGVISVEPGKSILDLLKKVALSAPCAFKKVFDENGQLYRNIIIVRNDQLINKSHIGLITSEDNDEIEILIQFAGG